MIIILSLLFFCMAYALFEVRVACFIFNDKKELFLLKNRQDTWGILGGHMEKDEQIEDTVHREAKEEANINVEIVKQFSLRTVSKLNSFVIGFACKYKSGKIKLQKEEVGDYKWVKLDELKKYDLTFKELPIEAKKAQELI